jgi:hypothetical protein
MIVREHDMGLVMIEQHEHGKLAGDFAKRLRPDAAGMDDPYAADFLLAVAEHDRGWMALDRKPLWNEETGKPYTFVDYPLSPKLEAYMQGLDEIEAMSPYAALICSLHFTSFTQQEHEVLWQHFLRKEQKRRGRLQGELGLRPDDPLVNRHLRLLQLCDDLSLYICMNDPGVNKNDEHPWFREGFAHTEFLNDRDGSPLIAQWYGREAVEVRPSPFTETFEISVPYRKLAKERVRLLGGEDAYRTSSSRTASVWIR